MESKWSKEGKGKLVHSYFLQESFWRNIAYTLKLTGPLVSVLRLVDGEKRPAMGYIYEAMDRAKESIAKRFPNQEDLYKKTFEIIDHRWEHQLHRPLHAAGHYLNPSIFYDDVQRIESCEEIMDGLQSCIERLSPSIQVEDQTIRELNKYKNAEGMFGKSSAIRQRKQMAPAEWWGTYGASALTCKSLPYEFLVLLVVPQVVKEIGAFFNTLTPRSAIGWHKKD